MDIDIEDVGQSRAASRRAPTIPVDDAHPFDLDSYIANYSGRTAVDRLIHILSLCPSIAPQAFHLAVQHIHQLRDTTLYQSALSVYEQSETHDAPDPLDPKWIEETLARNQADRVKLEVELKTYSNNMIKESIRMAHRDLGDFYRATGDHSMSLKHYTKSREFCTSSQQVLEMCLSILELLIEQKSYAHIPTYVFKADTALDAAANSKLKEEKDKSKDSFSHMPPSSSRHHISAEREKVQSKLDFATGLAHLGQANYEKAALAFLRVGPAAKLGDWVGKLVAPGDIAIYGTLCALSSFKRRQIKAQILENSTFGVYIEQEPYIRDLIEAYMSSNFKVVLELLARFSTRHLIDIHLSPHVHDLTNLIRNWAVVLYFQPFASIKLDRMSAAFGWTVEEVEQHVVALIQAGQIQGRVDSQNKILRAKNTDYRAELFARAMKAGEEMQNTNRKLLLRMRLQQADLIVKAPKGQSGMHLGDMILQD